MSSSRVRVSLTGTALEAADRILAATPIEGYSELFSFLLRRYEQDFITACNGFLVPQPGQPVPLVPQQPHVCNPDKPPMGQTGTDNPTISPTQPLTIPKKGTSDQAGDKLGQAVQPAPQKTAKQRLMDFED